jgi:hypothetical protein
VGPGTSPPAATAAAAAAVTSGTWIVGMNGSSAWSAPVVSGPSVPNRESLSLVIAQLFLRPSSGSDQPRTWA